MYFDIYDYLKPYYKQLLDALLGKDPVKQVAAWFFVVFLAVLYFLPSLLAFGKRNRLGIFLCNLLFGWTLLGWGVALIWAVTADTPEDYERRHFRR
jgi:hypothetical protein